MRFSTGCRSTGTLLGKLETYQLAMSSRDQTLDDLRLIASFYTVEINNLHLIEVYTSLFESVDFGWIWNRTENKQIAHSVFDIFTVILL